MKFRGLLALSLVVAAAMVGFAFTAEARLPVGTELPVHWNAAGEPDRFAPALEALLLTPIVLALIAILFAIIPSIEPLQNKLEGSAPVLRASWIGLILMMVVVQAVIGLPAFGINLPVNAIMLGLGLLLLIVGNALPKSRPGFFVGIRTPWAIVDTDNWIATHRLGGKLMMAAAIAIIIAAVIPTPPELMAPIVLAAVGVAVIVPFVFSWWLWRKTQRAAK